ncbi:MAG: DsbA family protein [Methyloceanibacter sp.]|nr:DsbA family protein [Methyloceanibacter sp.]
MILLRAARASIPIAVAIALSGCGGGAVGPAPSIDKATYVPPQHELMAAGPLGDRVLGKPTAPITMIEYASLTCPHCRNYHANVFPRLKREYIDTGKVRYIIREFPIGRTAGTAAIINRCAPEQKYLSVMESFLSRQPEWVSQEVRPDAIYSVAKSSGMTRETFDKCLSNQTIIEGLTEVKQRGRQFGVIGTPTFFINGRKAQGEVTFEEIKALIEQAPSQSS